MADTSVQHFKVVLDSVVYQWCGTSFKRGRPKIVLQLQLDHIPQPS